MSLAKILDSTLHHPV